MTLGRPDEATSLAAARAVARQLGIELSVLDLADAWRENVLDDLKRTYLAGRTPNPCVRCNETVKFGLLPHRAFDELGCAAFATGHYARLVDGRLFRAFDRKKDQSYFLARVNPQILSRTIFPLGELSKAEVRDHARQAGIAAADAGDSQDFCGGDAQSLVGADDREGDIVTADGRVLGRHRGFWHYTVGMRKGLGIGGGTPYYVTELRPKTNEVVVGFKDAASVRTFTVSSLTLGLVARLQGGELALKVRSTGEPRGPVAVEQVGGDSLRVTCRQDLFGVAPGQSAVFFRGDEVLGGGLID